VIDGENGGDDIVDPTCLECERPTCGRGSLKD